MKRICLIFALVCAVNFGVAQENQAVVPQENQAVKPQVEEQTAVEVVAETEEIIPDSQFVPTVAVLNFERRSRAQGTDNMGRAVAELLLVKLLESGNVDLVERAELDKALDELHLSAVGMVSRDYQLELGHLIGAKILITGSIFEQGNKKYAVAKIIGTETSRVRGCSVSGTGEFLDLVPELAEKVEKILKRDAEKLLPRKSNVFSIADQLDGINGNGRKVYLEINEDAAESALKKLLTSLEFEIVKERKDAEFVIKCKAMTSSVGQYDRFISVQARVELSVYQVVEEKLLSSGSRKETLASVGYEVAAKDAITQATLNLAADVLKKLK